MKATTHAVRMGNLVRAIRYLQQLQDIERCSVQSMGTKNRVSKTHKPPNPEAPCIVYLPTFGLFSGRMLVNIPYMEHG